MKTLFRVYFLQLFQQKGRNEEKNRVKSVERIDSSWSVTVKPAAWLLASGNLSPCQGNFREQKKSSIILFGLGCEVKGMESKGFGH